jgi:hypothetical protein
MLPNFKDLLVLRDTVRRERRSYNMASKEMINKKESSIYKERGIRRV